MLPLKGIRVLDITRLLPGGFCTYLLSSYGAEVVKVEEPGIGDYMRHTPPLMDGVSLTHTMINRGKRSVGVDLKTEGGKRVLKKLIKRSDVFVEGFRPGAVERLGFSFEDVKKLNSRVVYCSISAFGHESPLSSMPAHDLNFQALSGLLGSGGKPRIPFVQLGDYVAAMYAAIGILAALQVKDRKATYIDVPTVPSLMSLLMLPASSYFATGEPPALRQSLVFGSEPYYDIYSTSDGRYLSVAAIEPHFWENLLKAIGLSHLARLRTGTRRDRRRLREEMQEVFSSKTQKEWTSLLMGRDTCVTPIMDIQEALDSAWAKETGSVGKVGRRPVVNQPLKFSPRVVESDAPSLGEHTRPILRELGYIDAEIEALLDSGAVS